MRQNVSKKYCFVIFVISVIFCHSYHSVILFGIVFDEGAVCNMRQNFLHRKKSALSFLSLLSFLSFLSFSVWTYNCQEGVRNDRNDGNDGNDGNDAAIGSSCHSGAPLIPGLTENVDLQDFT